MSRNFLLVFNGAAIIGCAFIDHPLRTTLLTALLLLLPLLDWKHLQYSSIVETGFAVRQMIALAGISLILALNPDYFFSALGIIILVALPEEWFFRYWLMDRIEKAGNSATLSNIATSLVFAAVHIPTQNAKGLLVFFPSLLLGYLFQKQKDLIFVILVHSIFNFIYELYLQPLFAI